VPKPAGLRVLILEDRPDDAELVVENLRDAGYVLEWDRVDTEADFAARLGPSIDLILADYSLPQFDAIRALELVKKAEIDVPLIVVSGTIGEEAAVAAMRSGAHDYLFKDNLTRLPPAVERELRASAARRTVRETQDEYLRRLRSIFDSALDAVVTMDAGGRITDWNPMAEAIFGWSRSEVVGWLMTDTVIPERYQERHRRGLQHFLSTGQGPVLNKRLELEAVHRDGHEFPIELSVAATSSGTDYVFSGFVRDITERRRAEETARQLTAIVETSIDPIIGADLDGRILSWNGAAQRTFGYSLEEALGQSIDILAPDDSPSEVRTKLERLKQGDQVERFETMQRCKTGRLVSLSIRLTPIADELGRTIGATSIMRDVRSRARASDPRP
jgi:PAS domain S-box-containing protein